MRNPPRLLLLILPYIAQALAAYATQAVSSEPHLSPISTRSLSSQELTQQSPYLTAASKTATWETRKVGGGGRDGRRGGEKLKMGEGGEGEGTHKVGEKKRGRRV